MMMSHLDGDGFISLCKNTVLRFKELFLSVFSFQSVSLSASR